MGWMHDTLAYMQLDSIYRKYHHTKLTFRMLYAFHEAFMLPLSHDEVVHGKGSLIGKMPGDTWRKFANLRLLLAAQFAQPAKKLLFMGSELAQWSEWNHDGSLDWHLLDHEPHAGVLRLVHDLNLLYRTEVSMHELDCDPTGYEWVDCNDSDQSALSLLRRSRSGEVTLIVLNYTPVVRTDYRVGVPKGGRWLERLNTDAGCYGGSGTGNAGEVTATDHWMHGRPYSLSLDLPPLGALFFTPERSAPPVATAAAPASSLAAPEDEPDVAGVHDPSREPAKRG
jgi:1,4-alpha-glucan branching enzyme